jgi:hypothetical protein
MSKGQPGRAKLKAERRRTRPQYMIHVSEPGTIFIDQGKRLDEIDAPPGTVIERPPAAEHNPPMGQEI